MVSWTHSDHHIPPVLGSLSFFYSSARNILPLTWTFPLTNVASRTDDISKCKKHTILVDHEPRFNAFIRLLSSRVSPEYSLTELFIQFPPLQMSIIKSGNVYPRHRDACVLIKQKSAQKDLPCDWFTQAPRLKF